MSALMQCARSAARIRHRSRAETPVRNVAVPVQCGRPLQRGLGVRIVAIDASPRRGVVSRSVEVAARAAESAGATVERVRLADFDIRFCTGCKMCRLTGACKIDDDLPSIAELIASPTASSSESRPTSAEADRPLQAMLDRFASFFPDDRSAPVCRASRRATCPAPTPRAQPSVRSSSRSRPLPSPIATFFGYTTGPIRELRQALGSGGIRTVGSMSVAGAKSRTELDEWESDKAASLGRVLAGKI